MIKLIATDLDNTLLDHITGEVPESTARLFHRAAEKGVLTAVATGRCFPSALAAARTIGAHTPVICYNGSLIKWGDTGEVIAHTLIDPDTIRQVAAFCRREGLYLQCYDPDDVVVCERDCAGLRVDPDVKVVVDKSNDQFSDDEYCTETLAKIYLSQGFLKRAIDVYDKLILLYPEKSTYFATLKEEIKKQL
jgi:hydroxymethylpyrimidine pyrophosphatase-like HAD family hydrolase